MNRIRPGTKARHCLGSAPVATLVVCVALLGLVGCRSLVPSSSTAAPVATAPAAHRSPERRVSVPGDPPGRLQRDRRHAVGVADGEVPAGVTVFDDQFPAVTRLDPVFLHALRQAATVARGDGVRFEVTSGWRSEKYQQQLFDQAISTYGSPTKASRWVAHPGTSVHESGRAVDISSDGAAEWLARHGADYGLCQIYANEPWHYELRPDAIDSGCPATYADPTHDPRVQQ